MTVYGVESGEYSDHMLHALFTTEALAQEYVETLVLAGVRYEESWQGSLTEADKKAEAANVRERISIERYQLWDALPVVTAVPLYEQDHTEAVA